MHKIGACLLGKLTICIVAIFIVLEIINDVLSHVTLLMYHTRAIISRGLYTFYPISKDHFFVFKEVYSESSVLMYGFYSRGASNQEWLMMARVRYVSMNFKIQILRWEGFTIL